MLPCPDTHPIDFYDDYAMCCDGEIVKNQRGYDDCSGDALYREYGYLDVEDDEEIEGKDWSMG